MAAFRRRLPLERPKFCPVGLPVGSIVWPVGCDPSDSIRLPNRPAYRRRPAGRPTTSVFFLGIKELLSPEPDGSTFAVSSG